MLWRICTFTLIWRISWRGPGPCWRTQTFQYLTQIITNLYKNHSASKVTHELAMKARTLFLFDKTVRSERDVWFWAIKLFQLFKFSAGNLFLSNNMLPKLPFEKINRASCSMHDASRQRLAKRSWLTDSLEMTQDSNDIEQSFFYLMSSGFLFEADSMQYHAGNPIIRVYGRKTCGLSWKIGVFSFCIFTCY